MIVREYKGTFKMSKVSIEFPDGSINEFEKGITGIQVAESISSF